jgi:DNA (cytosine-5)-methyltransferase 1
MKCLSLFSGIGGIDLACQWAGIETVAFCEIEPFCQKVLRKNFGQDIVIFDDVRTLTRQSLSERGIKPESISMVAGGFPCQPFSSAGKREGDKDDRHLWPEMLRVVAELKPAWVVGENVAGLVNMALDSVLSDLEGEGYSCQAFIIPACAANALHRRDRVWIVAHNDSQPSRALWTEGNNEGGATKAARACSTFAHGYSNGDHKPTLPVNATGKRLPNWAGGKVEQPNPLTEFERPSGREVERDFRGVAHGVSRRVDRLKSLGNAVVPQQVYPILKAIADYESSREEVAGGHLSRLRPPLKLEDGS